MKNLLQTLSFSLIIICLSACGPKELPTKILMEDNLFAAYLSHETTQDELIQLRIDAKEKYQVDVDYTRSTFFEDGRLRTLDLRVDKNGMKGSTTADLMTIQFSYFGFKLNLDPKANVPFKIGSLGPN